MLGFNHPVVGVMLYYHIKLNRKRDAQLGRLFLHAQRLCFDTLAGERVCYESPLSKELELFLKQLK